MGHPSIQIHFIIGAVFISCVTSIEKQWIRSNTWNDPQNWNPPHLPCPNDKIILGMGVVYIEKNVSVKGELTLPRNGEVVFGTTSKMVFERKSRGALPSCYAPDGPVTFVGQTRKRWLNPLNWYVYQNGKKDDYTTKAAPYIDRIPCFNDKVSFPKETAFKIDIRDAIYIKEFAIKGEVIKDNSKLQSYLSSEAGKGQFNMKTATASLTINKTRFCGNDSSECQCVNVKLRKKICGSFICPKSCKRRVRPFKDCCDHCGALMNFKYERIFKVKNCWDELRIYLAKNNKYSGVRLYMSPMNSTDMQMLVTESEDGSSAKSAVTSIISYIKSKKSKACDGIKNMLAVFPSLSLVGEETSNGIITVAVLIPIILVILVILIVTYVKKKRISEITAMRFQNVDDISQYPGGNDIEMTNDVTSTDLYPGVTTFENPSYKALSEKETTGEKTDGQMGDVASPVYDIPLDYHCKQNYGKAAEPPRYVDSNIDGLSNPVYTGDQESYLDPEDVERGNINALYEEVMKDYPEKDTPDESVIDLESSYDNDSITKIKLELKLKSDSEFDVEVVGLGENEPSYVELDKEKRTDKSDY